MSPVCGVRDVAGLYPLGALLPAGPCPFGYSELQNRHQGLQPNTCTGCACTTSCSVTIYAYTTSSCGGAVASATLSSTRGEYKCQTVSSANRGSSKKSNDTKACVGSGTATQAPPTWSTSNAFCVAQTSPTCSAGNVCVPKPPASAPVCVDVDPTSSCPAGYSNASIWYTGYSAGSCGTCGTCTAATSLTCSSIGFAGTACTGGATDVVNSTCGSIGPSRQPVAALGAQLVRSGADNCVPAQPTNVPPRATGARNICCKP